MSEQKGVTCRDAVERLWEYVDGELPASEAENVRRHLEACRSCHPHVDFQKAFCAFLRSVDRTTAPPGLRRSIFLRLLEEEGRGAES